jgi:hypothetical protein
VDVDRVPRLQARPGKGSERGIRLAGADVVGRHQGPLFQEFQSGPLRLLQPNRSTPGPSDRTRGDVKIFSKLPHRGAPHGFDGRTTLVLDPVEMAVKPADAIVDVLIR